LVEVSQKRASHPPKILSGGKNEIWIRFHHREDRPGLFADYVQRLYSYGLGIRHAAVHTLPEIGVYDWFQVTSRKPIAQVRRWFESGDAPVKIPPDVKFESVSLVSEDENEWVFSFKGLDQPGCLAAAAAALAAEGVSLKSARVHTWGRQVDDLFHVQPKGDAQKILANLRLRFKTA
jgi:[protein-PII] uridylyltransferase